LKNYRVLIIEDDPAILHMLGSVLDYGGFDYETAETAQAAREVFPGGEFDVVLLDLSLPDFDGSQLIRYVRDRSQMPILVISGLAGEEARVDALDKGADDFIPKPFLPRELLARIRAALRRAEGRGTTASDDRIIFEPSQPYVTVRGDEVPLSAVEQQLLALLAARTGEAITNQEACKAIWGDYTPRTRKILYVVINRLRKKIERDPSKPVHLVAHHGIGYRLKLGAEPVSAEGAEAIH
jgi:two-component system, OmpR family, KDP operon response regulator KdpE